MGEQATTKKPQIRLSIIVGCPRSEVDPERCLSSLRAQKHDGVEVIVVDDSPQHLDHDNGWRTIRVGDQLVPEMWAKGLADATGDLVALTTGAVIPEPDWVDRLLGWESMSEAGMGGAIEPSRELKIVDWAIYFCRYAAYMLPVDNPSSVEPPGDNAVYRRSVLDHHSSLFAEAFWEPFIHAALRRDGYVLGFDQELVARQSRGMSLAGCCRQRFLHGRNHGRLRSRGLARGRILLEAMTAPLVPPLMTARVCATVIRKKRHVWKLLAATPLVTLFHTCWAAGEFFGRLDAVRHRL